MNTQVNRKPTEGKARNLEQELYEKNTFRRLTATGWYNKLEGIGDWFKYPKEEAYCGIPNDIRNQEMVEITYLFKGIYGKELEHRIESEPPQEMRGNREPIVKRLFYVKYKD
jgi:hypothetical protein